MRSAHSLSAEQRRLIQHRVGRQVWKRWGPYISDRAWGTVREDYSEDGSAWTYFTHDQARSKACRWGEDGLAGICDEKQILCFAPAFWNATDPILKERLFGLTGPEGNHGEDVKEIYYYLDATPTHSYMKFLYKYPQAKFPYEKLVEVNAARGATEPEYEILDTGIFDQSRYFDLFVEYAKSAPEEILIRITAVNRGGDTAMLQVIPQLWFRNTWAWGAIREEEPLIELREQKSNRVELVCRHETMGETYFFAEGAPTVLFTDNETNSQQLYGIANPKAYVKDAFHEYIIHERLDVVNPLHKGTKAGLQYRFELKPAESKVIRMVLSNRRMDRPFGNFDRVFAQRIKEADEFYAEIHHPKLSDEEKRVQRQALAGMLWSKEFYDYDMRKWLIGDNPTAPPPPQRLHGRNSNWIHMHVSDVMSMPDKWEYPWFAAWDTAFHVITLAMVDIDFAKQQLELLVSEKLMHPNGQVPAYEWEFSDVNPPVQAWAVWRVYNIEKHANHEKGDTKFLERCYHKLIIDFTWWVNRKDASGRNIFQGGFLGLDNISVFDRSHPLPNGGQLEQADATGWMALFSLNLMAIGLELAQHDPVYEHLGIKFFEHFMAISAAINGEFSPGISLWSDEDNWYHDLVHQQNSRGEKFWQLNIRSQVGLVPLFAAQVLDHSWFENLPHFKERYEWLLMNQPDLASGMMCVWTPDGTRCLLSLVNYDRLKLILKRVLDETEFLSPNGVRSLSRYHLDHPFQLNEKGSEWTVQYEPGEAITKIYGGNSNWRGPVWFPMNFMLITALRVYDRFYGPMFEMECPTGSGRMMNLNQIVLEIGRRLSSLFLRNENGQRPMYTNTIMQTDPNFRDDLLFFEYFHGDTGQGLGANHQTGWTGLVGKILDQIAKGRNQREGH